MCTLFGRKLAIISGIFLKKLSSMYKDSFSIPLTSFQFEVNQPLFYPKLQEKLLQAADFLQSLPCFLKLIPSVLVRSVNFKIPKGFLRRRPMFPDYFFVSCDLAATKLFGYFLGNMKMRNVNYCK